MKMQLNGRGGHIEQTYLYLDPISAAACVVPGSYAADVQAKVQTARDGTKHFSILSIKRYDREKLDATMAMEGWEPAANFRYDAEYHPLLMLLYRRTRRSSDSE